MEFSLVNTSIDPKVRHDTTSKIRGDLVDSKALSMMIFSLQNLIVWFISELLYRINVLMWKEGPEKKYEATDWWNEEADQSKKQTILKMIK